jgi:hypothetical protein
VKQTSKRIEVKKILLALLSVFSLTVTGIAMWQYSQSRSIAAEAVSLRQQLQAAQQANRPSLPAGAVKLSGCIPGMGEHWADPADLPQGPFYGVENGEVLSIEYMWSPDQVPGFNTAKFTQQQFLDYLKQHNLSFAGFIQQNSKLHDLHRYNVASFDLSNSGPHLGMIEPHLDLHFNFVDAQRLALVCPDSTLETAVTPEIISTAMQHGIPIPGMPKASSSASPSAKPR